MAERRSWEQTGAASGLLAALMFVVAFIMFTLTDATGGTPYPSIENAQTVNDFYSQNLNHARLQVLFTTLGIALFLWFLGSLWSVLQEAEGEPARGAAIALVAAGVGSALMLVALALTYAVLLTASPAQADVVPALFTGSAVLFALGGGVLSLFFFAVGKVILHTGVMGRWLGWLALLTAVLCVLAFTSPFWVSGILNPATGALGLWAWWAAFVVWVLLASGVLTLQEYRAAKASMATEPPLPSSTAEEAGA
ncbi:hypothetical protein OHB39_18020 [Streptomyces sp. NBC_00047]|uniref:hypothetical protein n=1 Tax=Streptomyces sp. NBC_00047 TaxID=2975627 RepID=UPI00224E1A5F|nr:hypothetical protein [Streptomyces sp. NBC_00047]MCX5609459.1 hypothetical protein [Streptomyces sp. NBC_00047]